MALFDFLKRKKEIERSRGGKLAEKNPAKKPEKISAGKKPDEVRKEVKPAVQSSVKSKKSLGFSYDAIKQPHISEKATYLSEKDQYIFEVLPNHNKKEVRKSVEGIYGVDVLSVNMIKIPAKKRRLGKTEGFRKAYKKAVVKIKNGQKIEIL